MYLVLDIASSIKGNYITNRRIQNVILKNWSTTVNSDGIEVFDKLYLYNGSVNQSTEAKQIYKMLGISLDELNETDWDGVDKYWIDMKLKDSLTGIVDASDFNNYVTENSTLKPNKVTMKYSRQNITSAADLSSKEIVTLLSQGINAVHPVTKERIWSGNNTCVQFINSHPLTFMAIMDKSNLLFDVDIKVVSRTVKKTLRYSNRSMSKNLYSIEADIEYTFTRKVEPDDVSVDPLRTEVSNWIKNTYTQNLFANNPYSTNRNVDLSLAEFFKSSFGVNALAFAEYAMTYDNSGVAYNGQIVVSKFRDMKTNYTQELLRNAISTDYQEESADWWVPLLTLAILIAAIALAPESGGSSLTLMTFLSGFALNLTIAIAVLSIAAYAAASNGMTRTAISFGRSITILSPITTAIGILLLVGNVATFISKISSRAAELAAKEAMQEATSAMSADVSTKAATDAVNAVATNAVTTGVSSVTPTITDYTVAVLEQVGIGSTEVAKKIGTGEVLNKMLNFLNSGFNIYAQTIGADTNSAEPTDSSTVEPNPIENAQLVQADFDNYDFIDLNERMDNIPYAMTEGYVQGTFNKYYNGAAA